MARKKATKPDPVVEDPVVEEPKTEATVIFVIRDENTGLYVTDATDDEGPATDRGTFAEALVFTDEDELNDMLRFLGLEFKEQIAASRNYVIRSSPRPQRLAVLPIVIPEDVALMAIAEAQES